MDIEERPELPRLDAIGIASSTAELRGDPGGGNCRMQGLLPHHLAQGRLCTQFERLCRATDLTAAILIRTT